MFLATLPFLNFIAKASVPLVLLLFTCIIALLASQCCLVLFCQLSMFASLCGNYLPAAEGPFGPFLFVYILV